MTEYHSVNKRFNNLINLSSENKINETKLTRGKRSDFEEIYLELLHVLTYGYEHN